MLYARDDSDAAIRIMKTKCLSAAVSGSHTKQGSKSHDTSRDIDARYIAGLEQTSFSFKA